MTGARDREPHHPLARQTGMTTRRAALGLGAGAVLAASAVLATPGAAHACSCVSADVAQLVEWADVVVWAEVVDARVPPPAIGAASYLLDVDRVYKGAVTRSAQVDSPASGAACGLEGLAVGRSYAFFLEGEESPYYATLCGGSGGVPKEALERAVAADEVTTPGGDVTEGADGSGEPDAPAGRGGDGTVGSEPSPGGPDRLPVSTASWAGMGAATLVVLVGSLAWLLRRGVGRGS